jgi:hypothetical protein
MQSLYWGLIEDRRGGLVHLGSCSFSTSEEHRKESLGTRLHKHMHYVFSFVIFIAYVSNVLVSFVIK